MARCFVSIGAVVCMTGSAMATVTLWNNGPLVTNPGAGAGGADVSAVWPGQSTGVNFNNAFYARADNFTVSGGGWNISSMTFFGFQTGSGNSSTITGLYARIWNGDPMSGGTVVWGNMTTNIMSSTAWTGIYRTDATSLSNTDRPIMDIVANGLNVSLADGQYWIEYAATGSTSSGPWVPLVSSSSAAVIGDSLLYDVTSSTWSQGISSGNNQGYELPFILNGTAAVPGSAVFALGLVGLAGSRRRR